MAYSLSGLSEGTSTIDEPDKGMVVAFNDNAAGLRSIRTTILLKLASI
jgi:hypothetical protein